MNLCAQLSSLLGPGGVLHTHLLSPLFFRVGLGRKVSTIKNHNGLDVVLTKQIHPPQAILNEGPVIGGLHQYHHAWHVHGDDSYRLTVSPH